MQAQSCGCSQIKHLFCWNPAGSVTASRLGNGLQLPGLDNSRFTCVCCARCHPCLRPESAGPMDVQGLPHLSVYLTHACCHHPHQTLVANCNGVPPACFQPWNSNGNQTLNATRGSRVRQAPEHRPGLVLLPLLLQNTLQGFGLRLRAVSKPLPQHRNNF